VVGVELPQSFRTALYQNYPNPFRTHTAIVYSLSKKQPVKITVFDVRGRRVGAGIYFFRLETAQFTANRKVVFLR
jgi:hypothetical protein